MYPESIAEHPSGHQLNCGCKSISHDKASQTLVKKKHKPYSKAKCEKPTQNLDTRLYLRTIPRSKIQPHGQWIHRDHLAKPKNDDYCVCGRFDKEDPGYQKVNSHQDQTGQYLQVNYKSEQGFSSERMA
jgi:hypothetical protein